MLIAGHDPSRPDDLRAGADPGGIVPTKIDALGRSRAEPGTAQQLPERRQTEDAGRDQRYGREAGSTRYLIAPDSRPETAFPPVVDVEEEEPVRKRVIESRVLGVA